LSGRKTPVVVRTVGQWRIKAKREFPACRCVPCLAASGVNLVIETPDPAFAASDLRSDFEQCLTRVVGRAGGKGTVAAVGCKLQPRKCLRNVPLHPFGFGLGKAQPVLRPSVAAIRERNQSE
jgi:hypothetical protein